MSDVFRLGRFVDAQDEGGTYITALAELRRGRKRSHWMWFVFPQLAGLGRSATAERYAISGLAEARAYAAHPVLGPRLRECAEALATLDGHDPEAVLGAVDALKLRSSMTLFARAVPGEPTFVAVLERWFAGAEDPATVRLSRTSRDQLLTFFTYAVSPVRKAARLVCSTERNAASSASETRMPSSFAPRTV